jgi:hypothetical protein
MENKENILKVIIVIIIQMKEIWKEFQLIIINLIKFLLHNKLMNNNNNLKYIGINQEVKYGIS